MVDLKCRRLEDEEKFIANNHGPKSDQWRALLYSPIMSNKCPCLELSWAGPSTCSPNFKEHGPFKKAKTSFSL